MEYMMIKLSIVMKISFFLLLVSSLVMSQEGSGIGLPAGHEDILDNPYNPSFSCDGQEYGYYADIESGCQIFHICMPIQDNDGFVIKTDQYSFFCGNGTVWDQQNLVCNHADDAFPCEESASLFGTIPYGE